VAEKEKLKAVKRHLAVLIKQSKYVIAYDLPKKWWPTGVKDPRSGECFTPSGAWDFIVEELEQKGTVIKEINLKKPTNRKGYVLLVPTKEGIIYVKIHFGGKGDMVIGRSFHYSNES